VRGRSRVTVEIDRITTNQQVFNAV
ncbi:MAG: hypothetical protein JWO80_2795, partial [Bryobacterales bacterium]|nr:hypothetical protein [Bryobacterales bacterium]